MINEFSTLDAQSELASLAQMTLNEEIEMNEDYINSEYAKQQAANEQDQAVHEIAFQASQIANGNQDLP